MNVTFSTPNKPDSWDIEDGGVIHFATPEDAKKAEALYRQMSEEIKRLLEYEWIYKELCK